MVTRFIRGTIEDLATLIHDDEKMKKSYLFTPPSIVSSYKANDIHEEILWYEGGHIYRAELHCHNRGDFMLWLTFYTRDGNKATLTEIRNSYNRMKEEE